MRRPVSQGGTNLSGGQKQRLAIARALVRRAEIYVFDDSFSALDFATDATLRAALKAETADATVFIVSQRIGTVMNADRIVVLDDGRVAGIGTHAELLKTLRGLPRDRRVAGVARGGGMSAERTRAMQQPAAPRPSMFGRGPMGGFGMPVQKAKDFKGTLRRLIGYLEPHRDGADHRVSRAGVVAHGVQRHRPEDAGQGDDEDLRGVTC